VGGTLSGTPAVTASGGVATFTGLSINKVGTGYTLTATATAGAPPAGATSAAFDINPGTPNKLVFTVPPASNVSAGSAMTPAIQVTVQDALGNTTPAFVTSVTIAIANNAGGGTLSGTASATPVNGVATFTGLSINKPGVGYTLQATAAAVTQATSSAFTVAISPGPARVQHATHERCRRGRHRAGGRPGRMGQATP
jgi:hypothetical protein